MKKRCARCNRELTVETTSPYGPICAKKVEKGVKGVKQLKQED